MYATRRISLALAAADVLLAASLLLAATAASGTRHAEKRVSQASASGHAWGAAGLRQAMRVSAAAP